MRWLLNGDLPPSLILTGIELRFLVLLPIPVDKIDQEKKLWFSITHLCQPENGAGHMQLPIETAVYLRPSLKLCRGTGLAGTGQLEENHKEKCGSG